MPTIPADETRTLRILITGFGPFSGVPENPSWVVASHLNNQTRDFGGVKVHITALEIPTAYSAVLNTIPALHASKEYDAMVHFGLGLPDRFRIERIGHKLGYPAPDAQGKFSDIVISNESQEIRGFGAGFEQFEEELQTSIDVDAVVERLKSNGFEQTESSNDAGRFVCEFSYFCSLACAQREGTGIKVLFVHVPHIGYTYELPDMIRAFETVIEHVALNV
ncbi:unnamed protein product [Rhizoctonia solani]|uniref:Pyroglutamyl-peptidase 1 n=1 Tax=Rhizoctonia solani TaxID=456999 RepID=A0A8H3AWY5_9AGAM|nr:unnamed protein product [Rhizoctonia solani]